MQSKWTPDPKVITVLEKIVSKNPSGRILGGEVELTWEEVLKEVIEGTPFGRSFHQATLEHGEP